VRFAFAATQGLPSADPWRHLFLLESLREGRGFALFDGQPYIWYSPVWYRLAAPLAAPADAKWLAAACSALAVPLFALYVHRLTGGDALAAAAGGVLLAGFGPVVAATGQLGAEALALLLLAGALALCARPLLGASQALWGGGLFGIAISARLQLALDAPLFLPLLRRPRAAAAFAVGAALPLALHWWRNHQVIRAHRFVFTWDGLATPSDGYGLVSTLAVQLHPSVARATRALYEVTHARPEWLFLGERVRVEMLTALALAAACVVASRRLGLALAALASLLAFALDPTLSARFLRIWLGLFPVLFAGVAIAAARLARAGAAGRAVAAALVLAPLAAGAPELRPRPAEPLEAATPPPELLARTHYLVNSGFYHPESLIYRYPERRFLGMPLEPERFAEFHALHPEYRAILWHGYNVQRELLDHLRASDRWRAVARERNAAGYAYRVWEEREER
jgi:hypothetical protein